MIKRSKRFKRYMPLAVLMWLALGVGIARADVVDEAYGRGNAAAEAGDWAAAVEHYGEARRLLPGQSAVLEHDLGVAHGNAGALGRASYHLRLALRAEPSEEVARAATRSLGILRRRAELQAAATSAQISSPEGWKDLLVSALATPAMAWISVILGWLLLLLLGIRGIRVLQRGRSRAGVGSGPGFLTSAALGVALCFVFTAGVHELAVRAERAGRRAIVLEDALEVREGPGSHRKLTFTVQGGSRLRIMETSPGWSKIRLPGGLEGWVERQSVGLLSGKVRAGDDARK